LLKSFAGNAIGDVGMNYVATGLRANTTLKALRVDANNIGDMGIEQLAVVLAQTSAALSTLSLSSNHIGDDGASTLAAMLAKNASLLYCNLDGTRALRTCCRLSGFGHRGGVTPCSQQTTLEVEVLPAWSTI
jgi:Ran GTPase-activating protein (RanGAP) involved in mRNA processing and transport